MQTAINHTLEPAESFQERIWYLLIVGLLIVFYAVTRPINHSESYDSINYALFAENFELGTAPDSRNILFHAFNRSLFMTSEWLGLDIRALELISYVSIITGAFSLVLFARLLNRRLGVSPFTAWTGASFLGLTYGYWRYTGAAEVYVPSIFLTLCCLSLIFRFLEDKNQSQWTLLAASVLAGLAVLFYTPNVIVLFFASFVLFCSKTHFFAFVKYAVVGALVVIAGFVVALLAIEGHFPSIQELVAFANDRNGEFRCRPPTHIALVKFVLAFGHDVLSAHWTRTIDPVRNTVDPLIPGCIYNFNVVVYAGKGIQYFTAIAAILFLPALILFARIHWLASSKWKLARPNKPTLFLICWFSSMGLIIGTIDPGSFEAWIPLLVPFVALIAVFAIEPYRQLGKQRTVIAFVLLLLCYNFFGGTMLWRNTAGDYFLHKTAWIKQELTEDDTVVVNEFDYRVVDYLRYHTDAKIAHLTFADKITFHRSHPEIYCISLDEFLGDYSKGDKRLFAMGDTLKPDPQIRSCRLGEEKFAAAENLAALLRKNAELVNTNKFGETYQIRLAE